MAVSAILARSHPDAGLTSRSHTKQEVMSLDALEVS